MFVSVSNTQSYTQTLKETACGNACFTLMTSSSKMGSWGIFHRLSSVAVGRPPPIPSPSALMYTTPGDPRRRSRGPGRTPPETAVFNFLEAPGVGPVRASVDKNGERLLRSADTTFDSPSSQVVYVNQAIPSRLLPAPHV